jgi:hypothetical protein
MISIICVLKFCEQLLELEFTPTFRGLEPSFGGQVWNLVPIAIGIGIWPFDKLRVTGVFK